MRCDSPITKAKNTSSFHRDSQESVPVRCGRCASCVKTRANEWSFRISEEVKKAKSAYFVTLTYATPPISEKGFMTLEKSHVQGFIKRLRKNDALKVKREKGQKIDTLKISYFCAGEYGEIRKRPHYHLILLNVVHQDSINLSWKMGETYTVKDRETKTDIPRLEFIAGNIDIQPVNINTIDYCVKYLNKDHKENIPYWKDVKREFNIQSKGLGLSYINSPGVMKYHQAHPENNYVTTERGFKLGLPRYIRNKILESYQKDEFNQYIKEKTEEREQKERQEYEKLGLNYEQQKALEAQQRQNNRKKGKKRD